MKKKSIVGLIVGGLVAVGAAVGIGIKKAKDNKVDGNEGPIVDAEYVESDNESEQ